MRVIMKRMAMRIWRSRGMPANVGGGLAGWLCRCTVKSAKLNASAASATSAAFDISR